MNPQIAKWNARYADREPGPLPPPSAPLPAAVAGVPAGRALDLACGPGRHAIWLAQRGWRVDAVDGSEAAIALLLANAERYGCRDRLEPHLADLEADPPPFTIARASYDLIVDCYFLHRPLFEGIRNGVRPGGLFVAALHLPVATGERGHRYVLRPGELQRLVVGWGWSVLHAAERPANPQAGDELGIAEIVARRAPIEPAARA